MTRNAQRGGGPDARRVDLHKSRRENSPSGQLAPPGLGSCVAGFRALTPHDLRHTAASLAIASGASVKHVQRMLGHKDAAMTLNVYASLFETDLDAVSDRLDDAIQKARAASVRPAASGDILRLSTTDGRTRS
jgi:integrase